LRIMTGDGNSRPVAWSRRQVVERPARCFLRIPGGVEQGGWLSWSQRHGELVQRQGQALTSGFDVGFLPRPAGEKSRRLQRGRQSPQHGNFTGREEVLSNCLRRDFGADTFDINANLAMTNVSAPKSRRR